MQLKLPIGVRWGTKARINIIAREEGSGTRSAFTELLRKKEITPKAIVQDSNGAVRQLVEDDPNAIGFISFGGFQRSKSA